MRPPQYQCLPPLTSNAVLNKIITNWYSTYVLRCKQCTAGFVYYVYNSFTAIQRHHIHPGMAAIVMGAARRRISAGRFLKIIFRAATCCAHCANTWMPEYMHLQPMAANGASGKIRQIWPSARSHRWEHGAPWG